MKRTILTTAAICAALLLASGANATTYYFHWDSVGSQNFDDANNWYTDGCSSPSTPGAVPTGNDRAVICSGQICNVTASAGVDTVEVCGTLNIQAGYTLAMDNGSTSNSVVDGTINLLGSGSTLSFTSANHSVSGDGAIDGRHDSAVIAIASGYTLTSEITIQGNCQIVPVSGSSTIFINDGIVHANNAGTLEVAPDSIGDSSGAWCVSTSASAVLKISTGSAAKHDGDICVSNGTLDINNTFTTAGSLCFAGGTIDVANGVTLSADGDGSCDCCW